MFVLREVPAEFLNALKSRLKLGDREKPVYRVEVDRLAFIPGRVEELEYYYIYTKDSKKIVKSRINPGGSTQINSKGLIFPIQAGTGFSLDNSVTSSFGENRGDHYHSGIDLGVPRDTPVVAAAAGVVVVVDLFNPYTGYGRYIDIKHGGGDAVTRYAHLDRNTVVVGEVVAQGQVIAYSGNTGYCTEGGHPIAGDLDDPDSPRGRGDGAHLHFEVRVDGDPVDPYPYLAGSKNISSTVVNVGDVVDEGTVTLEQPEEIIFEENFSRDDWFNNSIYTHFEPNFRSNARVDYSINEGSLVINFPDASMQETEFILTLHLSNPVFLDMSFCSDFSPGSEFVIQSGEVVRARFTTFNGVGNWQSPSQIYIQEGFGTTPVKFIFKCNGGQPKKFIIDYIRIYTGAISQKNDPGYKLQQEVTSVNVFTKTEKIPVSVGNFVYSDTVVLDNVINIERDEQFEGDAAEARVTVSNPNGIYGPDYSAYRFPELGVQSKFAYEINGVHIGVLSENTPVRIYEGYGLDNIRVFTGLIDKVDINGQDEILTFSCRNMYKKLLNKVITENKQYPPHIGDVHILDTAPPSTGSGGVSAYTDMDRFNQIVYCAQKYATHYDVDYKLILAIAKAETDYGTLGWGTVESGGYICGYGCGDTKYAGIEMQCKYVAMRIRDALGDRPITRENIEYLNNGGDLGLVYCANTPDSPASDWVNNVWTAYQSISDYNNYQGTASGGNNTYAELVAKKQMGETCWLKSAIIHDLVGHANMFGWRAAEDDLFYPDAVIEETYLIQAMPLTGQVVKAGTKEGHFFIADISSVPTINGWLNPYVELNREFFAFEIKVSDAIREVLKDTNFRSYCDRYGTYRMERIKYNTPVVCSFTEYDDLVTINKTIDWSRGRSHIAVISSEDGGLSHFIDKEILAELKGEVRTCVVYSDWAKSYKQKEEIALRMFWDMKRLCRTLQVGIAGRPELDILDRVYVVDKATGTRDIYTIKGIRSTNSDEAYTMILDLFWCDNDTLYR